MNSYIEEKIKRSATGEIKLDSDLWLVFVKQRQYTNKTNSIQVKLVDNVSDTTTTLGWLQNGIWNYTSYSSSRILWGYLPKHKTQYIKIIKALSVQAEDLNPYSLELECFKRRVQLQIYRLNKKLKQFNYENAVSIL